MDSNSGKSDEVDLRVIYNAVKGFFTTLWDYFISLLAILKKRWLVISIFFILGIGAGIRLYITSPPIYTASLTLSSQVLTNDYCADIIHDIQLIIEDGSPTLLANKLQIDTSIAKAVKRIEFSNYNEKLKEKYANKDTVVLGLPFKIKVFASTNSIFPTLQTALVNYLENNDYAVKRKEIKKLNNLMMRQKLHGVMQELDSLKNIVSANLLPRGNSSGFVFGQPLDPINVYKEGIAYFQKDLFLYEQSILSDNIEVINDFSARNKPDGPILWKSITKGIIIGLFLGIVSALLLERRKKSQSA